MLTSMANYSGSAMIGKDFLEASHESWVQNHMFTPEAVNLSTIYPVTVNTTQQWCEIADTLGLENDKRNEFLGTLARIYVASNGLDMAYILEKVFEVYPIEPITLEEATEAFETLLGNTDGNKSLKHKTWKTIKELSKGH